MFTFPNEYSYIAVTIDGIKYGTSFLNTKDSKSTKKCNAINWTEVVDATKS